MATDGNYTYYGNSVCQCWIITLYTWNMVLHVNYTSIKKRKKQNKKCQGGDCSCFSSMDPMFNIKLNQLSSAKFLGLYSK